MSNVTNAAPSTEIVTAETVTQNAVMGLRDEINSLGGRAGVLSSMKGTDQASRVAVAAAVSNSVGLSDELGKTIPVVHYIVQAVEMTDETTGEVREVPRVVFLDAEGKSHHAISGPLYRDLKTMAAIIGDPNEWTEPVNIKITEDGPKGRRYFKLQYV